MFQARKILGEIAHKLPFEAKAYSWDELVTERQDVDNIAKNNINPFNWEFIMKWNMQDCTKWLSQYDYIWGGKYR